MVTLSDQLKSDFEELFHNNQDYPEYNDMIVKKQYEKYPEIHYPMLTIQELNNENVNRYFNDEGEQVVYVGYQFRIDSEQTSTHTALENVEIIGSIIDDYMSGDKYYCLRRIGNFAKYPMQNDNNVITGYLRYEGHIEKNTNTIYRR